MTTDHIFDGDMLSALIQMLPGGAPKMEALQDAIRQADEAQDPFWRLYFRYHYVCEATFRDDPPKAIPIAAEFAAIFEENHDAMLEDMGSDSYLMITQMGIDPIVNLPQIPLSQWEQLMEQFLILVKRYGTGIGAYWKQMSLFWQYIDPKKASEYFRKCQEAERDNLSDCLACDHSHAARLALLTGDRQAAEKYIQPIETGEINTCSDVPQSYWRDILEDALNRGNLQEAAPLADKLYSKGNRDKSDLSYLGTILRCWAYTNPDRAVALFMKRLEWALTMWDRKKVYDFYKGAWICFHETAKRQDTIQLVLPSSFPLYQPDGVYCCAELSRWFYQQAEHIGQQFDVRNGSDFYRRDLAKAMPHDK